MLITSVFTLIYLDMGERNSEVGDYIWYSMRDVGEIKLRYDKNRNEGIELGPYHYKNK